jgi:hypothetical protein
MATTRAPHRENDPLQSLEYSFRFLRGELYVALRGSFDYQSIVYSGSRETATEGDVILF